jgi:hypothetical protein
MSTFIRFHTSVHCERAKRRLGIFHALGVLQDEGTIEDYFSETVEESLRWFNKNLTAPRIAEKDRSCLFWFCADRQQFVARLWELVAILAEHNVEVRRVRTNDPGMIVYRDDFQVAALPSRRIAHALRV